MKPTQEQVIAWAREAGFRIDQEGEVLEGDDWHIQTDVVERFATLAYEAGRKDENEACAKVCDEQEQRSQESSEKSKRERDRFMYHHCAVTAKWNAAAIRARREP